MADKRVSKSLVEWADAPASAPRGPTSVHVRIARELKANPGVWGRVRIYPLRGSAACTASNIRTGRQKQYLPAGSFEAATGVFRDGYAVYARYVGEVNNDE